MLVMRISIIGTGNVGGTLAIAFHKAGHEVFPGVRDVHNFKGREELLSAGIHAYPVGDAVQQCEVIVIAAPATAATEVARSLGDTRGKIIIDTMNIVKGRGPAGYSNTADAILDNTDSRDVVKCFNTTGFENMKNPVYKDGPIDMFVAGDSEKGKTVASSLARDIGFGQVHDLGGNESFHLIEQLANVWINQAIFRGEGRDIAFRLVRRSV